MSGPFDAQPVWTTACPDWEERILARKSLIPFAPLFPDEAAAALNVFNALRIVDAPGSPLMADAAQPWVKDFVAAIFGAYDPESGRRLINEFLLLISKKNSKSTTAAGIMLTALVLNWRESAEFIILAPTIEIAKNSFDPVRDMIRKDPELSALLLVQEHTRTVTHRMSNATLKVVAADNDTVGGKKAVGVLVDELWIFGKRDGAENMLREATGGLASRPEGFVIYLTTQADEPPCGVFRSKLLYARGIRDGRIKNNRFLPVIYEFPQHLLDQDLHKDPAYFYVTNPNLGTSVDEMFLADEFGKAQEAGEESVRGFLAKHLNVEIGMAMRSDRWVGADYWEAATDSGLSLENLIERSEVITVGIDGGGMDDLLGVTVIGRELVTRRWLWWSKAWCHEKVLVNRKQIAPLLRDFEVNGDLVILTDDSRADLGGVCDLVALIRATGKLGVERSIGVDRVGLPDIVDELERIKIKVTTDDVMGQIVSVRQGFELQTAILTAERRLSFGDLVHADQPLLTWCVSNAKTERRGNAVMITKQKAGVAKIDPLIAGFNAVSCMSLNPKPMGGRSVWDSDEFDDEG